MRTRGAWRRLGPVEVGGVTLVNPFMTASGTSGHDVELSRHVELSEIGAVVVKSLLHEPWAGNPPPRVHVAGQGMMNAVGLEGPGVPAWCAESLPRLESAGATTVVSIWGRSVDEYVAAARLLAPFYRRVAALEVNLSCPNLEGRNSIFAHSAVLSGQVVAGVAAAIDVPVWAKLSANTDRIVEVADSVRSAGARAVTLINTMLGMQISPDTGRYSLGNGGGGLSGPPVHPIAVRAVHDVATALPGLDIIGVGGISDGRGAVEMMMAGARCVQVGTAAFARPDAISRIRDQAAALLVRRNCSAWSDVVGAAQR